MEERSFLCFPFKNIGSCIVLETAGALFQWVRTSAFYISVVVTKEGFEEVVIFFFFGTTKVYDF